MKPFLSYLSASRAELTKVTWPNRRQTIRLTLTVVVFAIVFSAILGTLDFLFSLLIQKLVIKG
jgi:preprotein translocase subunit SecE